MYSITEGEIPRINVKNPGKFEEELLQKFGAADFRQAVQRNIEKDYIEKTAALMSVASIASEFRSINSLYAVMERSPAGGVKAQFPIESGIGNQGLDTSGVPLVPKSVLLDRANVTYKILHEAMIGGGDPAENDAIIEGQEQLGAQMDHHYLTELKAKKLTANDVDGGAWLGAGDPFADINSAINKIVENSAINANGKTDAWFTVIVPIKYRVALEKITIIDGLKIGLSELIRQRLGAQIVYTRPPFFNPQATWPLVDEALVIPTKDRHVGRFYTFDGGSMPSIFVTTDENGKRVSTNSWMKFSVTPNEKTGSLSDNQRIGLIGSINA